MYAMAMKKQYKNQEETETSKWQFVAFFEDQTIAKGNFLHAQLNLIENGGAYQKELTGSADQLHEDLNLEMTAKAVMSAKSIGTDIGSIDMVLIELQTIKTLQL